VHGAWSSASASHVGVDSRNFTESRSDPRTEILEVVVNGDWALERFRFETTIRPLAGGSPSVVTGRGTHVYRRESDGVWRIAYDTFETEPEGNE